MTLKRWKFKGWTLCGIALISLAAGSLIATTNEVGDSNRVFELRVYHVLPGKMPALEARFRDTTSKLLAKHDLKVVGYWVAEDNTFFFMAAHTSRKEAKQNWDAFRAAPEFQEMAKSEQRDKLVEKIDSTYMRPTNFSPMK